MKKITLMLDYWMDDGWYVGKLKELPHVFSQGETLAKLEENIQDAYNLWLDDANDTSNGNLHYQTKSIDLMAA